MQNQEESFHIAIQELKSKLADSSNHGKLHELLAKQKLDEDERNSLLTELEDSQKHADAKDKEATHNFDDLNNRYIELEENFGGREQKISAHEAVIEKLLSELETRDEEVRVLKVVHCVFLLSVIASFCSYWIFDWLQHNVILNT